MWQIKANAPVNQNVNRLLSTEGKDFLNQHGLSPLGILLFFLLLLVYMVYKYRETY